MREHTIYWMQTCRACRKHTIHSYGSWPDKPLKVKCRVCGTLWVFTGRAKWSFIKRRSDQNFALHSLKLRGGAV